MEASSTTATTIQVSHRVRNDLVAVGKLMQVAQGRTSPPAYNEVIAYLLERDKEFSASLDIP